MPVQWFVKTQAGQAGPFSSGQLKQLVVEGKVTPETGLRRDTDTQWFVAKQFKGIFGESSSPPPPEPVKKLPPVKRPPKMSRSAQSSANCGTCALGGFVLFLLYMALQATFRDLNNKPLSTVLGLGAFAGLFVCSPLALIFGIIGLRKIKRSRGQLLGRAKAQFGTIVGGMFTGLGAAMFIPLFIVATSAVQKAGQTVQLKQQLKEIQLYIEQKKNQEAIDACTEFLKANPGDARAYFGRAKAAMQLDNIDSAIADYTWIIDAKTSTPEEKADAYELRGECHNRKKNVGQAMADYSEAIRLNPSNPHAWNNRGGLYASQGQLDEALADYTAAIGVDKEYARAYANRGDAYLAKGEYDKVVRDCTEAIRLAPGMPEAYTHRAIAYLAQEKLSLAIGDANKAVEFAPDIVAYVIRGKIHNGLEKYKEAVLDLTKAVSMKPDAIGALSERAIAYFGLHENDKALADANTVLRLNPNSADAYFIRSKVFESLGDEAKAKADMAKATELNPDFGK